MSSSTVLATEKQKKKEQWEVGVPALQSTARAASGFRSQLCPERHCGCRSLVGAEITSCCSFLAQPRLVEVVLGWDTEKQGCKADRSRVAPTGAVMAAWCPLLDGVWDR